MEMPVGARVSVQVSDLLEGYVGRVTDEPAPAVRTVRFQLGDGSMMDRRYLVTELHGEFECVGCGDSLPGASKLCVACSDPLPAA